MALTEFRLQIVTPDGLLYDGEAQKLILRTTEGDVGILARHSDFVTPLSIGVARLFEKDGEYVLIGIFGSETKQSRFSDALTLFNALQ